MLELTHRDFKPLMYKADIYKGQKEDKWTVKKIINYNKVEGQIWYKVLQENYNKTIQEPKENLKNLKQKV